MSLRVSGLSKRFIPVGTGNTLCFNGFFDEWSVHPRGHGEHIYLAYVVVNHAGSSPWARGTPNLYQASTCNYRFIPVGTGNTQSSEIR